MNRSALAAAVALAATLLIGHVTDRTTGQPLRGVHVRLHQGSTTLHAVTDARGRFRLPGVLPGKHVLRYSSDDVPPAGVAVTVHGAKQSVEISACSTTLDYSCAGPGGG